MASHFWARELVALGHEVKVIPPSYVKTLCPTAAKMTRPDAEAICEAVTRPNMRFVPIKTENQQAALMLHKARELLIRQQTMLVNALRGHMAETRHDRSAWARARSRISSLLLRISRTRVFPALAKAALKPLVMQTPHK